VKAAWIEGIMTNGDYTPPPHPLHLENDRKQARITFIGLSISMVVIVILILLTLK
jgi:hypothetical protein